MYFDGAVLSKDTVGDYMQESTLLPSQPRLISFSEFITALIQGLQGEEIRPLILRNYEGFPEDNDGSDVDFLILRSWLPRAIRTLGSIPGIRVVGYAERHYVAHLFVEGVSVTEGVRALAVDFIWSLNWKGQPYLHIDALLQAATPRQNGNLSFFTPSPVHEAITSLSGSLISGGVVKEKYFPKVQESFASHRSAAIAILSPQFGTRAATRLVDSVIAGNRREVQAGARSLRTSLFLRSLLRRPLRGIWAFARYHALEFSVRLLPQTLETIRVVSLGDCSNSSISDALVTKLQNSAKVVELYRLGQDLAVVHESTGKNGISGSCVDTSRGSSVSIARVITWLANEWWRVFRKRGNLSLDICQSSYYGLLVRCRDRKCDLTGFIARFIFRLIPSSDLWIVLEKPGREFLARNEEAASTETVMHAGVSGSLLKNKGKWVVFDGSQSAECIAEKAYAAIIDVLTQRASKRLGKRLRFLRDQPRET